MPPYLLDSDSIIDYLKGFSSSVSFIAEIDRQGEVLATCDIVIAEVHAGLYERDRTAARELLATLAFLPSSRASASRAGDWKFAYARQGQALSLADCLIAAIALEHGAEIVTANIRDFPMPEVTVLPLPRARPNRDDRP